MYLKVKLYFLFCITIGIWYYMLTSKIKHAILVIDKNLTIKYMGNSAAFKTKFNEYIDKNFWIEPYLTENRFDCYEGGVTEFELSIMEGLRFPILSELLYRVDPVKYEELFEQWLLERLINEGGIS